jgi:hypothetical protein
LFVNDLQDVDAELYNSMKWVMENPIDEMGFVFRYFIISFLPKHLKKNVVMRKKNLKN